jgi:2-succinyl-5-enolpyruvyl-6-hydroxy-3-cyclohexene-1-carboxylate synthase
MTDDANTSCARCLVDEWTRGGITDAVVSPGSRSTPLALALAEHPQMKVHVHIDERSAAFFALGLAKATGRPSVVLCTSGTAAANFHPAVLEAFHSRTPMIVCTADRPPEMRQVGEAQTVDQARLYGTATRWCFEVEAPGNGSDLPGQVLTWRALGARAIAESMGAPAGPVHLNIPFREPLVPLWNSRPPFDVGGRDGGRSWSRVERSRQPASAELIEELSDRIGATRKGVLVAGWRAGVDPEALERLALAAKWPILADPISGQRRGPLSISTYDALSRIDEMRTRLRPDLVLRVGSTLTSKHATRWFGASPTVFVDPDRTWSDPQRSSDLVINADPSLLFESVAARLEREDSTWLDEWTSLDNLARRVIDTKLDSWAEPFEGRVARDVMACLPNGSCLVVASSMPVRDLESFARPRVGVNVLSNRGVNGVDGFVSTVLGIASSQARPLTAALTGDLSLLHDSNGLLGAKRRAVNAVFVVIDNNGGGIFSFLPQAALPGHFEELFGTPHDVDICGLANLHGVPLTEVTKADEIGPAIADAALARGLRMILVRTRRDENVKRHSEVVQAVARALGG